MQIERTSAVQEGSDYHVESGDARTEQVRRIDLVLESQGRGLMNCQASATFTAVAGHHVQCASRKSQSR